jgi:hypothetical protein
VVEVTTYSVKAERADSVWLVHVTEIERTTQARTVAEIEPMARDLVAVMRDVEPGSFELDLEIELPGTVRAHLDAVEQARADEAQARRRGAAELRAAAAELKSAKLTVRDVGALLGVSHQRASQLTAEGADSGPRPSSQRRSRPDRAAS